MQLDLNIIIPLFILFAGFIVGLGAVTVIDLLGFLGQRSSYWTEATIRSHKVTKVLIWIGITLVLAGLTLTYSKFGFPNFFIPQFVSLIIMVLNGLFLSFYISPALLKRESEGKSSELLPKAMQLQIFLSFILSFTCWWGNLLLVIVYLTRLIG